MTAEDFTDWREHLGLNRSQAAAALGVALNTITAYERGQRIPLYVALACSALAMRLPPWPVGR